jgi:alpha-galactosidase/6-phospho-beta-glucosidase family protein
VAKIVMIGGGSYNWMPHLVRDMMVKPELAGSELWLVDIDKKALKDLEKYCWALLKRVNGDWTVHATTERDEALPKADFVVITISTGGLEAMRPDLEIPYKYGIFQAVGDTVGPGGLARALRNIPVFVGFARSIKKHCPKAWVLNLTNPMTVLTQVLCEHGCKTVGLCHELYGMWGWLRDKYQCNWEDICLDVAGLNHFAFILSARYKNRDCFAAFRKLAADPLNKILKPNVNLTHAETHGVFVFLGEFFSRTGFMLYPGDRHTSEFFSNVLTKETGYGKRYNIKLTYIKDRYKWLNKAKKHVWDLTKNPSKISLEPSREAMSGLMVSLATGKPLVEVVNLPNTGQIDNLPRGVVVETMATITADKISPHTVGRLPDELAVLLTPHAIRANMTIRAALTGDRRLARQVMASDPLVRDWNTAGEMLDKLIKANKKYLPQF